MLKFFPPDASIAMQIDVIYIPIIFGLVVAAMLTIKPMEINKLDLSSLFMYWPEFYRLVEVGNFTYNHVACGEEINAPPGIAYRVLNLSCRFKP